MLGEREREREREREKRGGIDIYRGTHQLRPFVSVRVREGLHFQTVLFKELIRSTVGVSV
jgi:hypothetical protein